MALEPIFVVGVGGSGVRTLMALQSVLLRRLRALPGGWPSDRLPEAWQLLAIDTEANQPSDFDAPRLLPDSYHSLVSDRGGEDRLYGSLVRDLLRHEPDTNTQTYAGWLQRRYDRRLTQGAGQFRAIGRAVSAAGLVELRSAVADAHLRMRSSNARTQLDAIATTMGEVAGDTPVPVVVTSIAGGTGAGMFIDVIEAMRSVNPMLGRDAQVLLYGADVFAEAKGKDQAKHVEANALAAVSEIVAGVWGDAVSEGSRILYDRAAIAEGTTSAEEGGSAFGSRYHYFIGAVNRNDVAVAVDKRAFWAVADAIGALVGDPSVLGSFRSHFIVNVFNNSFDGMVAGDSSGLTVSGDSKYLNPFASLGSGRLSVGSDRLLEYAVQALTRSTVERLLWPAYASADEDTDTSQIAERRWRPFLASTGLDERDHDEVVNDEVVDGLYDENVHKKFIADAVQRVFDEAASGSEIDGLPADEWTRRVLNASERALPDLRKTLDTAVKVTARGFIRQAERRLLRSVSASVARHGISVTRVLLRKLREDLDVVASDQLPAQARNDTRRLDEIPSGISATFTRGLGDRRADAHDATVLAARWSLEAALDAWLLLPIRRLNAAEVCRAFAEEVIPAIDDALRSSAQLLQADIDGGRAIDRTGMPYVSFPRLREPAGGAERIGPTEVLLEPLVRFEPELDHAGRATVGPDLADQWDRRFVERAVQRLPLDHRDGEEDETGLFTIDRSWTPRNAELRRDESAVPVLPNYLGFRSVLDVADEAERLLRDRETPVGRLVARTLSEYLRADSDAERSERERRFVEGFVEMMRLSAPLTSVSDEVVKALHSEANVDRLNCIASAVPLKKDSDLFRRLREALTQAGLWDDQIEKACSDADPQRIDVFQSLGVSLGIPAFPSITRPAWGRWIAVRENPVLAESFWANKRARPLIEAIPIARPRLEHLAAGWFAGLMLGRVHHEEGAGRTGRRIRVFDTDVEDWSVAPHPLLSRTARDAAVLPALLESLPLALAECGASGDLVPLRAYRALIDLGGTLHYESGALTAWIAKGEVARGLPVPPEDLAGSTDDTPAARRDRMLVTLDTEARLVEAEIARVAHHSPPQERVWQASITWELRDVLLAAIADVRRAVHEVTVVE